MSSFPPWMTTEADPPWLTPLADAIKVGLSALYKEPPMTVVEWADIHPIGLVDHR